MGWSHTTYETEQQIGIAKSTGQGRQSQCHESETISSRI